MFTSLRNQVSSFVREEILPAATERKEGAEFPEDLVQQMRELGLFGTIIPREYGGLGLTTHQHVLLTEELARGWLSMAGVINPHALCTYILMQSGTDKQRAEFLPRLASGELRAAISLTEPSAGSDVAAIVTQAQKTEHDNWLINGQKRWVTNGLGAGLVLVLAVSDANLDPTSSGTTCFMVEKEPWTWKNEGQWAGVDITESIPKMGDLGVETTDLVFDEYVCESSRVLGGEAGVGKGFLQIMSGMEFGRIGASSLCVGIAQRCLEVALEYALKRRTFGKSLAQHQSIMFSLAEMATKVEAARLMTSKAAREKDQGERSDLPAGMAKLLATEYAIEVAESAFRIFGASGYDKNFEIERLYRDALSLVSAEGPPEIQRLIIGRSLLKRARAHMESL